MGAEIGLKIKRIREYRNYTQQHVADKLEISQNAYSKIENGTTKLTTDRLEQLSKVLDVPVESILNGEKQIFNLENNTIEKFYGYIENLHEENKGILDRTLNVLQEQSEFIRKQSDLLVKALELLNKKL